MPLLLPRTNPQIPHAITEIRQRGADDRSNFGTLLFGASNLLPGIDLMNALHTSTHFPPRHIVLLVVCSIFGLCAACSKPPTSTPDSATPTTASNSVSNTTTASAANDPEVIDETPTYGPAPEGKVLRHAVFFSFKEESSDEDIQRIVDAFRELPSKIEEIVDFEWGTNNSLEGLDDGLTHCFILTFKDEAGRAAYLPHDAHKAFGNVLRGHNDKVFVIDYW